MARAEITFEPSAKHQIALFFMRNVVTQPSEDVLMKADSAGVYFVCGKHKLILEAEVS